LWRVYLCFIAMALFGFMVIGRVVQLQFVQGEHWRNMGDSMRLSTERLDAQRGTIFSDNNEMLSASVPQYDVRIDFRPDALRAKNGKLFYDNIDSLSYHLSKLFADKTRNEYRQELVRAYKKREPYYLLKPRISFEQWQQMRKFPLVRLHSYKSGYRFENKNFRYNPFGLLANRTIGLSRDTTSSVGLEKYYDAVLKGQSGERVVRYISGGTRIPVDGSEIEPVNGKDVVTTLNVQMQDVAENALYAMMKRQDALTGTAIVMEVSTGKIKAIANLGRMPNGDYYENNNYALMPSEPGSTIKLVTLLAGLEDKYVTLNSTVEINGGRWDLAGRSKPIFDVERSNKEVLNYREAFVHSSNVAMSKLAYLNYSKNPKQFIKHYHNLYLDQKSGIDLADPYKSLVKNPANKNWHYQTLASMGFGYEVTVSPLQILMVYNAVANNGRLMKPYLVSAVMDGKKEMKKMEPVVLNEKICSATTLAQLRECMEGVCIEGTARSAFDSCSYTVAGKTGTAKVDDATFDYGDGAYQSSFAGYFPANNPRYSCIVVIKNKPGAALYTGGSVAAPVFKAIADRLVMMASGPNLNATFTARPDTGRNYYSAYAKDAETVLKDLQLPYKTSGQGLWSRVLQYAGQTVAGLENKNAKAIPDVRGMGLRDALDCLENKGVKVMTTGKGKVASQSLPAGTLIQKNMTVYIELK
jgi:cell division protein FtsI (penicillin-binding protein 3)